MNKKIIQAIKISALALVLSVGIGYALAWSAPTSVPPAGNVSAPINTSATPQTKVGALTVQGLTLTGVTNAITFQDGSTISSAQPVINEFTVLPSVIQSGQTAVIRWGVSNATTCTASGDWTGSKVVNGVQTETTAPLYGGRDYQFILLCSRVGAVLVTQTASVSVLAPMSVSYTTPGDYVLDVPYGVKKLTFYGNAGKGGGYQDIGRGLGAATYTAGATYTLGDLWDHSTGGTASTWPGGNESGDGLGSWGGPVNDAVNGGQPGYTYGANGTAGKSASYTAGYGGNGVNGGLNGGSAGSFGAGGGGGVYVSTFLRSTLEQGRIMILGGGGGGYSAFGGWASGGGGGRTGGGGGLSWTAGTSGGGSGGSSYHPLLTPPSLTGRSILLSNLGVTAPTKIYITIGAGGPSSSYPGAPGKMTVSW